MTHLIVSVEELTQWCAFCSTTLVDHQDKCRFIFTRLRRDYEPMRGARCVYYDLQSIIYSLDDLGIKVGDWGPQFGVLTWTVIYGI